MLIAISTFAVFAQKSPESYVEDELLVKFSSVADVSARESVLEHAGAVMLETFPDLGWVRVKLADSEDVATAAQRFAKIAEVEAVQPNFYYHLLLTPNDPQFASAGMYGLSRISAPQAWDLTTGSSAVVVADIDTGLRYTHQDLAANTWTNVGEIAANGIDDDNNGFIDDVYGYDFRYFSL